MPVNRKGLASLGLRNTINGFTNNVERRPFISSPMGIVIGVPVSVTFMPRTRPSVPSMEIVLTRSSPRCCWVSRTTFVPSPFITTNESRILGNFDPSPSKATSTTGPITWVIFPIFAIAKFLLIRSENSTAKVGYKGRSTKYRIQIYWPSATPKCR